jgi:hypothetical protein
MVGGRADLMYVVCLWRHSQMCGLFVLPLRASVQGQRVAGVQGCKCEDVGWRERAAVVSHSYLTEHLHGFAG